MPSSNPIPLQIPPHGAVLGLDVGTHRVGVAISNSAQSTALGKGIWPRSWAELKARIAQSGAVGVVLGAPLHMNGEASPGSQRAADVAALIRQELGIPTALMDERLTTQAAQAAFFEQRMVGSRQSRASTRDAQGQLDAAAAVLLLQTWLDARHATR
jgi:putative Holliday junction resolvase